MADYNGAGVMSTPRRRQPPRSTGVSTTPRIYYYRNKMKEREEEQVEQEEVEAGNAKLGLSSPVGEALRALPDSPSAGYFGTSDSRSNSSRSFSSLGREADPFEEPLDSFPDRDRGHEQGHSTPSRPRRTGYSTNQTLADFVLTSIAWWVLDTLGAVGITLSGSAREALDFMKV